MDQTIIRLPPRWTDASVLEKILRAGTPPLTNDTSAVNFYIPRNCQLMTDAVVRLLSFLNQLDQETRRVTIIFEETEEGVLPYLDRIGFFQSLSSRVAVLPERPSGSAAVRYGGRNPGVVEIQRIYRAQRDESLPRRLTSAIATACEMRRDVAELEEAAWTIFAELIDNVFLHSETYLDGFAALQVYRRGGCLKVAVSDSGRGILETLRPALMNDMPKLATLRDVDLIVEVFRQGLSRHGPGRGCGLKGCADKAIKFGAQLDVRLPRARVLLIPGSRGYTPNRAYCYSNLPVLWGTHICFTFNLTKK
jgi:hypothetical protein